MLQYIYFLVSVAMIVTTAVYEYALLPMIPGEATNHYIHQLLRVNLIGWLVEFLVLLLLISCIPWVSPIRGLLLLGTTAISLGLFVWNTVFLVRQKNKLGEKEKTIFIVNTVVWLISFLVLMCHFLCCDWLPQFRKHIFQYHPLTRVSPPHLTNELFKK